MTQAEKYARMREDSREAILRAALALAVEVGLSKFKQREVAERAGRAKGSVTWAFGSMAALRSAVVIRAVEDEVLPVVAQALALGFPEAAGASPSLKRRAIAAAASS